MSSSLRRIYFSIFFDVRVIQHFLSFKDRLKEIGLSNESNSVELKKLQQEITVIVDCLYELTETVIDLIEAVVNRKVSSDTGVLAPQSDLMIR